MSDDKCFPQLISYQEYYKEDGIQVFEIKIDTGKRKYCLYQQTPEQLEFILELIDCVLKRKEGLQVYFHNIFGSLQIEYEYPIILENGENGEFEASYYLKRFSCTPSYDVCRSLKTNEKEETK